MNGWDILALIGCYVLAVRVLRWGYRTRVGCPDKDAAEAGR